MQARTHWHDLLGRHCPRFGQDGFVRPISPTQSRLPTFAELTLLESCDCVVIGASLCRQPSLSHSLKVL